MKKMTLFPLAILFLLSGCKPIGDILTDFTAPNGLISINSGAAYTNSSSVLLTLDGDDAVQMYVTNTAGCESGGTWEAYSTTKSWTLGQTNATATVYVRFKDRSQNVSRCVSDSISNRPAPTITAVSPSAGQLGGGTTITLTGTGFVTGLTITVAGTTCSSPNQLSATQATCVTPAKSAGTYDVVVTNLDTQAATMASAYTYQAAPTLTSVYPYLGPSEGGTAITITGTGFLNGAGIKINNVSATSVVVVSNTSITAVTPPGSTGSAKDIRVINLDTQEGTKSSAYTYYEDTWSPITTTSAPTPRQWHSQVWTGTKMIIWGGYDNSGSTNTGGLYDPDTVSWTATSTGTNVPASRSQHSTVWTGSEMIVWGGGNFLNDGGSYNPSSDTWTSISTANAPDGRTNHSAIWTGSKMIVWGGNTSLGDTNTGGIYDPSVGGGGSWTPLSTTDAPTARRQHFAFWTGDKMLIWGGDENNTGGMYDPENNTWAPITNTGAPPATYEYSGKPSSSAVWTGSKMIVWGGQTGPGMAVKTGAIYNPANNTWTPLSTTGAPDARASHQAVWTGTKMIIWGGVASFTDLTVGGIYDPSNDSWSQITNNTYQRSVFTPCGPDGV
jgi:hypothetical protein